jgi:hypothetical protein
MGDLRFEIVPLLTPAVSAGGVALRHALIKRIPPEGEI